MRFTVRFVERRRKESSESGITENSLRELFSRGLRWVDHFNYFGPDRRGEDFSFFFLERRRAKGVGKPPPLRTALRQLRVRLMNAEDADDQTLLRERLVATALLADAQGFDEVGRSLRTLASNVDSSLEHDGDPRPRLHNELNRIESMLV
jgi:hypothetical protein